MRALLAALLLVGLAAPAQAALDLSKASITRLDNGLTLIVLEDHAFPVVSVQTTYKAGGKNDPRGRMGLAHFVEHMAFRQSKNFPGVSLASSVYAVGGEWHGYTWIDTTNYFETAPKSSLDLLLRIEADRMGRLELDPEDVKAEAGAVISEMRGYENDPSSLLYDAVLASAFAVHPYRLNTIGYEASVKSITRDDVAAFYETHYAPSNAVLAVVGDVDAVAVARSVEKYFGAFPEGEPTPLPPASEPAQTGERRVRLEGATDRQLFKIAYPAPSARSEDFAAFLILVDLAGASSGINFDQNAWGDPVRADSALGGVTPDITTFFIPTAEPYVFMVSGSLGVRSGEKALEDAVQRRLSALQTHVTQDAVDAARQRVLKALAFDVQTTGDAAHQLAYFEGIGALNQLFNIKARLAAVTAKDVMRVARLYLDPRRRTIGWMTPKGAPLAALPKPRRALKPSEPRAGAAADPEPAPPLTMRTLDGGVPVAIQASPLSPTAAIEIVAPGALTAPAGAVSVRKDDPAPGYTTLAVTGLARDFDAMVADAAAAWKKASFAAPQAPAPSEDPQTRLRQIFDRMMNAPSPAAGAPAPLFIAAAGDFDPENALATLDAAFSSVSPATEVGAAASEDSLGDVVETIAAPKAQAALGYIAKAPGGDSADSLAWRIALYILAHDYGGRLGEEAISKRGLLYYIDAEYRLDRKRGWASLAMGVDPNKLDALRSLLKEQLKDMADHPPSNSEIAEAKRWILGRKISAAQSNEDLAEAYVREFVAHGALRDRAALKAGLDAITRDDIIAILPELTSGAIVAVKVGGASAEGQEQRP